MLRVAVDGGVLDGSGACHATTVEINDGIVASCHLNHTIVHLNGTEECSHFVTIEQLLGESFHLYTRNGEIAHMIEHRLLHISGGMRCGGDCHHGSGHTTHVDG